MKRNQILLIFLLILFIQIFQYQVNAQDREDKIGPIIRFTGIEGKDQKVFIEGYTIDSQTTIKQITYVLVTEERYYSIPESSLTFTLIETFDGKYDSNNEKFAFSIPEPNETESNIMLVKILDSNNNKSIAKLELFKRGKEVYYISYLSKSALNFNYKDCDEIFRIYYSSNIDDNVITETQRKLISLKKIAHEKFGFKYYEKIFIALYNPDRDDIVTFKNYRGILEDNIFTFPMKVKGLDDIKNYSWTIDEWIPHELGDHSTRHYFKNESDARWLSEGIGELLSYIYLKENYPDKASEVYQGRIELFRENKQKVEFVNLLDGEWGAEYYLCSLAFIADIFKSQGTEVFKKLFLKLNDFPCNGVYEKEAQRILGESLGKDITPVLTHFSTDEAIKILEQIVSHK